MAKNQFISNSEIDGAADIAVLMHRLKIALAVLGGVIFLFLFTAFIGLPFLLWACVPFVGCSK